MAGQHIGKAKDDDYTRTYRIELIRFLWKWISNPTWVAHVLLSCNGCHCVSFHSYLQSEPIPSMILFVSGNCFSLLSDSSPLYAHFIGFAPLFNRIFMGFFDDAGLNKRTTSENLGEAFSKFGEVVHARIVTDRNSGFSKGFGFVRDATSEEAEKGMKGMDAQVVSRRQKKGVPHPQLWHVIFPCGEPLFVFWLVQFLDGWVIFAEHARPRSLPRYSSYQPDR
ncbi:unnamed protein product [Citrullus colocynthis]|uniref:RRM domain-containing protein n=1 Tax=Citrullus colocynthis TaxID=252529 RepID=A0ABP0YRU0_9ROSI